MNQKSLTIVAQDSDHSSNSDIIDFSTDKTRCNLQKSSHPTTPDYTATRRHGASLTAIGYASHYRPNLNKYSTFSNSRIRNIASDEPSTSGYNTYQHRIRNRSSAQNVSVTALGQSHNKPETECNQCRSSKTESSSSEEDSMPRDSLRCNLPKRIPNYRPITSKYGPSTSGYNTYRYRNRNRSSRQNVSVTALRELHHEPETEGNQCRISEIESLTRNEDSLPGDSVKCNLPTRMPNYGPITSRYGPSTSGYNTYRHRNRNRSNRQNFSVTALGQSHHEPETLGNQCRRLKPESSSSEEDSMPRDSVSRNLLTRNPYYGPSTFRNGPSTSGNVNHIRQWGVHRKRGVYRNSGQFMIPRAPFSRAVKQILEYTNANACTRMTKGAMETCQEDCEKFFTDHFNECYLATLHAKRVTLMTSDMLLIRRIKGRTFLIN